MKNKKISYLVILVMLVFLGINVGCFRETKDKKEIEKFTDSNGIKWRVLYVDGEGNKLIITEHVYKSEEVIGKSVNVQYNTFNSYSSLEASDNLRVALNKWFDDKLAPELKEKALKAENINNDIRLFPMEYDEMDIDFYSRIVTENESTGWTKAGSGTATSDNAIFVLSISEVNKYKDLGTLNIQGIELISNNQYVKASWWLRSPGSSAERPTTIVDQGVSEAPQITPVSAVEKHGFRPSLWISP